MSKKTKKLVPKLRFPEFRDTKTWDIPKLASLGTFTGGGTPSRDRADYWVGKNAWVSSSDISEDGIIDISITRFISDEAIQDSATKIVPENSILLVSRVGVGKLAISNKPICTSQDFTNFTPVKDNLVFLAYSLKNQKNKLLKFNQGMAIKVFTKDDISNLEIPLPTCNEQQKIADCLSSIDDLISTQNQKVEALKTHKKGLMQQLFPREGEAVPRLRFPEFWNAGEWEIKPFSSFVKLYRGSSPRPIQEFLTKSSDGVNWIKIGDTKFASNFVLHKVEERITKSGAEKSRYVEIGELILANSMSYGKTYQLAISGCIYDGWFVLREYDEFFHKPFLLHLLNSDFMQKQYESLSAGGIVQNISSEIVYNSILQRTLIAEQQKIANCLSSIDDLINVQTQKLEALKSHKKGLMQQLFPSTEADSE